MNLSNQLCCGCGACAQVCPHNAVRMEMDVEGFLYPEIDDIKCTECTLCEKACPVIAAQITQKDAGVSKLTAYAAYCKDEKIRLNSSSGGVFTPLAEEILSRGGVVFGAAFDWDWSVHHIAIHNKDQLWKLQGSKYLQSRTEKTYEEAKQYLVKGKPVLYTGTPCEIEGLKTYLGKEYDTLYTQDLICHGCPSPKLWKKYVSYQENRAGAPARRTFFRHKKYGWKTFALLFEFSNNKVHEQILSKDLFMQMFLQNICLRPCCYNCAFKRLNRVSDITLADFWGCDNVCPELDDNKGLSLVLIHSEKGQALVDVCSARMIYKQVDIDEALKGNSAATQSCEQPFHRDEFMSALDYQDIPALAKSYLEKPSVWAEIRRMIPAGIKVKTKKIYKRIKQRRWKL